MCTPIQCTPMGIHNASVPSHAKSLWRPYTCPHIGHPPFWTFKNSNFLQLLRLRKSQRVIITNFVAIRRTVTELWRFNGFYHATPYYHNIRCSRVCLSVTSPCSTEMAKHRITQTTPHDSPVFWCWKSWQNSKKASPPTEMPNSGGVG